MSEEKENYSTNEVEAEDKKKQVAGLNGIRPEAHIRNQFKKLCEDYDVSQTKMFSRMLWTFLGKEKQKELNEAIDFRCELDMLDKDMRSLFMHLKDMTEKAQSTILSERSNYDQKLINMNKDLETKKLEKEALEKRNKELEEANEAFGLLKDTFQKEIEDIKIKLKESKDEVNNSKLENADLLKKNNVLEKENSSYLIKNKDLERKNQLQEEEISSLKRSISIKRESEEVLNEKVSELKKEVKEIRDSKAIDIEQLKHLLNERLKVELDMAVLEVKRQLNAAEEKNLDQLSLIYKKESELEAANRELEIKTRDLDKVTKQLNELLSTTEQLKTSKLKNK